MIPYWLVAVQLLDGVGAGIFGALFPVIVKDLTQGTGRFNVSLGALSTVFGLGAALSNSLAGFVVQQAGYNAAFLTLAGVAAVGIGAIVAGDAGNLGKTIFRVPYNCRLTYATMRAKFQHTSPIFCSATGFRALMSLLMPA